VAPGGLARRNAGKRPGGCIGVEGVICLHTFAQRTDGAFGRGANLAKSAERAFTFTGVCAIDRLDEQVGGGRARGTDRAESQLNLSAEFRIGSFVIREVYERLPAA